MPVGVVGLAVEEEQRVAAGQGGDGLGDLVEIVERPERGLRREQTLRLASGAVERRAHGDRQSQAGAKGMVVVVEDPFCQHAAEAVPDDRGSLQGILLEAPGHRALLHFRDQDLQEEVDVPGGVAAEIPSHHQ